LSTLFDCCVWSLPVDCCAVIIVVLVRRLIVLSRRCRLIVDHNHTRALCHTQLITTRKHTNIRGIFPSFFLPSDHSELSHLSTFDAKIMVEKWSKKNSIAETFNESLF
jgi:hypothetical protein